jgi:hypothetical protein
MYNTSEDSPGLDTQMADRGCILEGDFEVIIRKT